MFVKKKSVWAAVFSLLFATLLFAAQSQPIANVDSAATVSFTLDFPSSDPEHYSIAVESSGHSRYESSSNGQSYSSNFEISAADREKIFQYARQAQYFARKIDSGNHKLAFTGTKTLSYHDDQRSFSANYDYSTLPPVRDLTSLFQAMAGTLEYGRRLDYEHRYQKLALDEELKRLEAQAKNNELVELQSLAPALQSIADDASVINVVRMRARSLLAMGSNSNAVAKHGEH